VAQFTKGQSGNPSGRPKAEGHVRELARAQTERAIKALVEALDDSNGRVRVAAATALLDRGWGRPTQAGDDDTSTTIDPVASLLAARRRANLLIDSDDYVVPSEQITPQMAGE
jgi:HEAT repeat protein